jgi:hypothetical protein
MRLAEVTSTSLLLFVTLSHEDGSSVRHYSLRQGSYLP